jgi:hypothetical protein
LPSEITQGQNTVQLHDSAISPFKVQASLNAFLPAFCFLAQIARGGQWAAKATNTKATPIAISAAPSP